MQVSSAFDKSLWLMLAQGSMAYEKCLTAEQYTFFVIGKFEERIKYKSQDELLVLRVRLIADAQAYPGKAYFYDALLSIVKSQLKKIC